MKTESNKLGLFLTIAIIAVLFGGLATFALFPRTTTETVEVPVEVPGICDVSEVCEACETCEATPFTMLDDAVDELLFYLDDEDMLECDGEYNLDEVTVSKVYDEFKVKYLDDDEYLVTGSVKLNFKEDGEKRCRDTFDFKVLYEDGEDAKVTL